MALEFLSHTWSISVDAAPWLLMGLVAAGVIKAYVPDSFLGQWLGGRGSWPVLRAAFIGAPLPLCSCGVLPAALGLHRQGASKGATVSFLVATPETGVDSVAVSYALLGPFLTVVRPIAAILSAVAAGLTCNLVVEHVESNLPPLGSAADSCCRGDEGENGVVCSVAATPVPLNRPLSGLRYAMTNLLDDLSGWLAIGILLAGAVSTFVGPQALTTLGSGLPAMLAMLVVGIPIYACDTASTPLAAAMLQAGVSPGTVLVFLLAGPATNVTTIGLVRRELGTGVLVCYLAMVSVSAVALGLLTDLLVPIFGIDIHAQASHGRELIPEWLAIASLTVLAVFAIRPLRRILLRG